MKKAKNGLSKKLIFFNFNNPNWKEIREKFEKIQAGKRIPFSVKNLKQTKLDDLV